MKTAFRKSFVRDLKAIKDEELLRRVRNVIEDVEAASSLQAIQHVQKMAGASSFYRIRLGDYRLGIAVEEGTVEFVR